MGLIQYFPAVFEVLKKLFPFISMADPFAAYERVREMSAAVRLSIILI